MKYHLETSIKRVRQVSTLTSLPAEFTSDRLRFRLQTAEDQLVMERILAHPRVVWRAGPHFPLNTILRTKRKWATVPYTVLLGDEIVGGIVLTRRTPTDLKLATDKNIWIELGYTFHPAFWNQGLATEAVQAFIRALRESIEPEALFASVKISNEASARVLVKNGFRKIDDGRPYCFYALSSLPAYDRYLVRWQRYARRQRLAPQFLLK